MARHIGECHKHLVPRFRCSGENEAPRVGATRSGWGTSAIPHSGYVLRYLHNGMTSDKVHADNVNIFLFISVGIK